MTQFIKPDAGYWERKFIAYMHDPLDKVFRIPGHEERAASFLEKYGLQAPNEAYWRNADRIAAGFERGCVPSYSPDPNASGAVDFMESPIITHPTSEEAHLEISTSYMNSIKPSYVYKELIDFIENKIGMKPGEGGYSDRFKGDNERFAVARFLYTHLILRFRLAEENVGGLGALWHRVPADSRFPDHSIWQHNALCSAIYSCIELAGAESGLGLMVFSLTPVQQFIAKARKLRDYWTGSILLSWLSFEGMRWVIENLGPDHIVYPSLIDQPLVTEYMKKNWNVSDKSFLNPPMDMATLPNKFVFLIPMNLAEAIASEVRSQILREWNQLCNMVCDTCTAMLDEFLSKEERTFIKETFEKQNNNFWDLQWSSTYLISDNDKPEVQRLLPEVVYKNQFDILDLFKSVLQSDNKYEDSGRGVLYSVTHSLLQAALASSKMQKKVTRLPETGEKCHLCGEFEVIHHRAHAPGMTATEYKEKSRAFWGELKRVWDGDEDNRLGYNLNKNEMLCSVCLVKRMASQALRNHNNHILHRVLGGKSAFPSTTEVALTEYFKRNNIAEEQRQKKAQEIHDEPSEKVDNPDRYFAILLMDGDNMGRLINGETLGSTWESIMHPQIVERLKRPGFTKKYRQVWNQIFEKNKPRVVTPAIHAAISEALGDFSLYGVARIVKEYEGALIYAGGDDLCAVMPVAQSLQAAREIQRYYTSAYKVITENGEPEELSEAFEPRPGKLSINLGKGNGISISAAILICHHKESLSQMIMRAHHLLDDVAKKVEGKNACAIELRKRSGGSRYFIAKWGDQVWDAFLNLGTAIKSKDKAQISSSVVYRLERLRDGVQAILKNELEEGHRMLKAFITRQLEKSEVGDKVAKSEFGDMVSKIVVRKTQQGNPEYRPEGLIVAGFMAKEGK